jgi:DNA-binding PadR family transcriptional regulator
MFKRNDFFQHTFFNGQSHFRQNDFFNENRFHRVLAMEGGNFEKTNGFHFFSGKGTGRGNEGNFFRRGDIKIVLLKLLQEKPRHGYDLIKVLEERFKGFYSPSPGSIYPTLQMLEDQSLVDITKEGRKKVYHLTDEGETYLGNHQDEDPIISRMNKFEDVDLGEMQNLRSDIQNLFNEFFTVGRQAMVNPEKKEQLQKLLTKTRKELSNIADDGEKNKNGQ